MKPAHGALALAVSIAACGAAPDVERTREETVGSAPGRVAIVGIARTAKLGALLETDAGTVWIDGLDEWPDDLEGRRVRAEGVRVVRDDLPVFVREAGAPERSGIPVANEEEAAAARRRTVLVDARWRAAE